jgi:hypothetical protein
MAPLQQYAQGQTITQILNQPGAARNVAGAYGMIRGLAAGMGQGPVGMISQVVGGAYGAAGGQQVGAELAQQMGLPTGVGRVAGAEIGRQTVAGTLQRFIQEGMQRYPGYLATSASMAQPGMYGADVRRLRGLGAARFGYGPEQIGPEFSALYQGFGGGALTRDTEMTAMAYSRAYGVSMGQQGQAIGGLINIGGGGQAATAEQRQDVMLRVMTDAVAAGFGRRLPEFAQSVSAGVGVAMAGPGLVRQSDVQGLVEQMSTATARISRDRGIGLQQAGRITQAFAGAPGGLLRGLMQGGGDPRTMGLMAATSRERFGGDMFEMAFGERGLLEAQGDPFGRGMEFIAPMMQQILEQSSTRYGAATSIQNLFQGMGVDAPVNIARDITERGGALVQRAREEGREVTTEEMTDLLQEISGTIEEEGPSLEETMRDIQSSGETIMRDQLGAMRAQAGFAAAQFGLSAQMAGMARGFYAAQLRETANISQAVRTGAMADTVRAINDLRVQSSELLGQGDYTGYLRTLTGGLVEEMFRMGTEVRAGGGSLPPPSADYEAGTVESITSWLHETVGLGGQRRRRQRQRTRPGRVEAAEYQSRTQSVDLAGQGRERRGVRSTVTPIPREGSSVGTLTNISPSGRNQ